MKAAVFTVSTRAYKAKQESACHGSKSFPQIPKKLFYGKVLQKHMIQNSCKEHGGEDQSLRLDQKPHKKHGICGEHFSPDQTDAHKSQKENVYGVDLSPDTGIKDYRRLKKPGQT